jgi:hypothetical protein
MDAASTDDPRAIALRRLARAAASGMSYREYTLEKLAGNCEAGLTAAAVKAAGSFRTADPGRTS